MFTDAPAAMPAGPLGKAVWSLVHTTKYYFYSCCLLHCHQAWKESLANTYQTEPQYWLQPEPWAKISYEITEFLY